MRAGLLSIAISAAISACSFQPGTAPGDATPNDAIDGSTVLDTDGDGLVDASDNCPERANPEQRDFDGDTHGDLCDRCPHLPDPSDPDGDDDGVGDPCDPRPSAGGDRQVLWEGFDDPATTAAWIASGGTWSVSDGVVTQSDANTNRVTFGPDLIVQVAQVTAQVRPLAFNANPRAVGVRAGVDTDRNYVCFTGNNGANVVYAGSTWPPTNNPSGATPWNGNYALGEPIRLDQRLDGNDNTCIATDAMGVQGKHLEPEGPTAGKIGLATQGASASFEYLFVVEIGT